MIEIEAKTLVKRAKIERKVSSSSKFNHETQSLNLLLSCIKIIIDVIAKWLVAIRSLELNNFSENLSSLRSFNKMQFLLSWIFSFSYKQSCRTYLLSPFLLAITSVWSTFEITQLSYVEELEWKNSKKLRIPIRNESGAKKINFMCRKKDNRWKVISSLWF